MKKLLSLLLALTMILPLVGCVAFAENADPIMITVIATSDVHGKVLPINYATGEPDRKSTRLNSSHNVISRMPSSA